MRPYFLNTIQLVIFLIVAEVLIPERTIAQSKSQIVQVRQSPDYQSLKDVKEIALNTIICDLKYDSTADKVVMGLMKTTSADGSKNQKLRYEDSYPEEYMRWFPERWINENANFLICIDPHSYKESWKTKVPKRENWLGRRATTKPVYHSAGYFYEKNKIIDIASGKTVWKKKNETIFGLFPEENTILSFRRKKVDRTDSIHCRNLNDGKNRWSYNIVHSSNGWNDFVKINDSTFVLSVSGLNFLDKDNGLTMYQPASTVDDIGTVIGIGGDKYGAKQFSRFNYFFGDGIFSSYPLNGASYVQSIWGMTSQVLSTTDHVYSASHNNIVCTDHSGSVIWEMVTDTMASGKLFINDSVLAYINKGYGFMPQKVKRFNRNSILKHFKYLLCGYSGVVTLYSVPELLLINRYNGNLIYRQNLSNKYDMILDVRYLPGNDTLQILTRTKIILTSISTGNNLAVKEYSKLGNADLCSFAANDVWLKDSTGVYFPTASSISNVNIMLDRSRLWLVDKYLNNVAIYHRKDIWHLEGRYKNIIILKNETGVVVLSDEGKQLMRLPGSGPACLAGSKLYVGSGNLVTVFNLDDLSI